MNVMYLFARAMTDTFFERMEGASRPIQKLVHTASNYQWTGMGTKQSEALAHQVSEG